MSNLYGMPGLGGSLGKCALCGETFVVDLLMSMSGYDNKVHTVSIDGIDGDLCLHKKCIDTLKSVRGKGWESLPEGPLRSIYAEAAEATQ